MINTILNIKTEGEFSTLALEIFHRQAENNEVYQNFMDQLKIKPKDVDSINKIPFLPIDFFKNCLVEDRNQKAKDGNRKIFISSGTTESNRSYHYVSDVSIYEKSFTRCFEFFYGNIENYCLLALLPSYLENKNSSLIYMVDHLIRMTNNKRSGYYLNNFNDLKEILTTLMDARQKTILLGVSYALLDFAETHPALQANGELIIMETGGMKGRRKEMIRPELHEKLCAAFGEKKIHSEYGMTELLSQAFSRGEGLFHCPPWMRVITRDINDPFQLLNNADTGGINIIDLANINSCSFIATQDLGKVHGDGSFEVLGRFDNSDMRGCSLLV